MDESGLAGPHFTMKGKDFLSRKVLPEGFCRRLDVLQMKAELHGIKILDSNLPLLYGNH
jgi:hypothetical protein